MESHNCPAAAKHFHTVQPPFSPQISRLLLFTAEGAPHINVNKSACVRSNNVRIFPRFEHWRRGSSPPRFKPKTKAESGVQSHFVTSPLNLHIYFLYIPCAAILVIRALTRLPQNNTHTNSSLASQTTASYIRTSRQVQKYLVHVLHGERCLHQLQPTPLALLLLLEQEAVRLLLGVHGPQPKHLARRVLHEIDPIPRRPFQAIPV